MEKWYQKLGGKKYRVILAGILLCILVGNAFYWGMKKEGFFGDELYSYHYVNQIVFPYITEDREEEPWMDTWHSSVFFQDYLTISREEAFNLSGTYRSIAKDVHPPLFYLLMEMSCSAFSLVFPGVFSKWCGILINIVFFILTLFFLYKLAEYLTGSPMAAMAACVLYGLSIGAVSTVVFIRMYMIFTCFSVLFAYLNALLWKGLKESRIGAGIWAALFLSTILGVLTHYYFFIYAFFVCVSIWLYALVMKKFRFAVRYAGTMAAGLVGSYLLWPDMGNDIFRGYRGTEAFGNFAEHTDLSACKEFFSLINIELFGGCGALLLLFMGVAVLGMLLSLRWKVTGELPEEGGIRFLLEKRESCRQMTFCLRERDLILLQILLAVLGYIMVIAKVAPYREDRYLFNVLPMVVTAVVYIGIRILEKWENGRQLRMIALLILLCFTGIGYLTAGVNYLYRGTEEKLAVADSYSHLPAFYIHQGSTFRVCGDSIYFSKADYTYPTGVDKIAGFTEALGQLETIKGSDVTDCLLYIDLRVTDTDGILEQVKEALGAKDIRPLFHTEYSAVYLVERNL